MGRLFNILFFPLALIVFFHFGVGLYAQDSPVSYEIDERVRAARELRGDEISIYVEGLFSRARRRWQEEWHPREAWGLYLQIEREIPEELIQTAENFYETARIIAWREMKALLKAARQREDEETKLFLAIDTEPADDLFMLPYREKMEGGLSFYEISELLQIVLPYVVTERGAKWLERLSDAFFEQGDLKRARSFLRMIKDYSVRFNDRTQQKIERLSVMIRNLPGSDIKKVVPRYEVVTEREGRWNTLSFLEIRFPDPTRGDGDQNRGEDQGQNPDQKKVRRRLYDVEINLSLLRLGHRPMILEMRDEVIVVPRSINRAIDISFFDSFGNFMRRERLSKTQIMQRYGIDPQIDLFPDKLFSEIRKGRFEMGSPMDEEWRGSDKRQHGVELTHDFYMQKTEVTQRQWEAVMGNNPSYFKGPELPVERISWVDAVRFANRISELKGLAPCYRIKENGQEEPLVEINGTSVYECEGYRLPTEAEWEYAARAGSTSTTAYSFGDDPDLLREHGWFYGNSQGTTHSVASCSGGANAFGLHDMHGNVWEWVFDWYGYYPTGTVTDPVGPATGSGRVLRGGGWYDGPLSLRSADRDGARPADRGSGVGFRLLRTIK